MRWVGQGEMASPVAKNSGSFRMRGAKKTLSLMPNHDLLFREDAQQVHSEFVQREAGTLAAPLHALLHQSFCPQASVALMMSDS